MSSPPRRWPRALARILAVLAPALALGWVGRAPRVDVHNHALKDPGSADARAIAMRNARFGDEKELVVLFQALPVGSGALRPIELAKLDALRESLLGTPLVRSISVSAQERSNARLWRVALAERAESDTEGSSELVRRVREATPSTLRTSISGLPLAEVVLATELQTEQRRVTPWVAGALTLLLLAVYRHLGLVTAVLAPPALALASMAGLQALWGRELTPVTVLLAPVVLTVGVAAGVHWVEAYLDARRDGQAPPVAADHALEHLRKPALLASLTTVIGFLALSFNAIPAVADFGVLAALGVALTYAIAAVATPALLELLSPLSDPAALAGRGAWTARVGPKLADAVVRHAPAIRVAAIVVAAGALALALQLEVDNDPLRVLPSTHAFRRQTDQIVSEFGGSETFEVLAPQGSPFADPVQMGLFAAALCQLDGVSGPAGPALVSADGDWLARFVLAPSGSGVRERLFDLVETRAATLGAPQTLVTGLSVQIARDSGRMVRGALWGAIASLALLWLVFAAGFRSAAMASIAIVPNALPCAVVNAGLALWGAPLSFATAVISSTMLGLIVDDTIHMLHRYRELRRDGLAPLAAIEGVYQRAGRAVLITSAVLALGFAVGAVGELTTSVEFSALAALTIVTALAADLILLPAILVRTATFASPALEQAPA